MLSKRSLGSGFFLEIAVFTTAILIITILFLSFLFSTYLHSNIQKDLTTKADFIIKNYPTKEKFSKKFYKFHLEMIYQTNIIITDTAQKVGIKTMQEQNHYYIEIIKAYPNTTQFIKIKRDITEEQKLLINIYWVMLGIIIFGTLGIVYYASKLSLRLMEPVHRLAHKFSNMNESILRPIPTNELPNEYKQLGKAFNNLISKIQTSINYRKELYVGTAHELKTPLAVMRLKSQITLMKYKKNDYIRETLQQNMDSVDTLNNMIHNILEYGRAEGGQFEEPKRLNIVRFMAHKAEEYELLAHSQSRDFIYHFEMERFMISIQPILFMHIFQNFIQNALRFTPKGGLVTLSVRTDKDNFIVEVIDEGEGVDESVDLFAPFKRSLQSTGAGLGLFIAQNAAESMGVEINLENRKDAQGAVASIKFPFSRFLHN